jgi:hypothetical protein
MLLNLGTRQRRKRMMTDAPAARAQDLKTKQKRQRDFEILRGNATQKKGGRRKTRGGEGRREVDWVDESKDVV